MNAFFKTFFICLILTISFICYKLIGSDSYSPELSTSDTSSVFGTHEENIPDIAQNEDTQTEKPKEIYNEEQKYDHICYFYSPSGKLEKVKRELTIKPSLEHSISLLLKGPRIQEEKRGIYSEIPSNVMLLGVKRQGNSIIVDLSSNFGKGGGSQSVENRVSQLSQTIKSIEPNKDIYLYIDGNEVEYLGGEGVYIKQPLD